MDQIYREQLIDHYKNPRNEGSIDSPTHEAELKNLSCGDEIHVYVDADEKEIKNIKFEGEGCAICIASASLLFEDLIGEDIHKSSNMEFEDIQEMLGVELSPSRIKCAHLALLAIQKALEDMN